MCVSAEHQYMVLSVAEIHVVMFNSIPIITTHTCNIIMLTCEIIMLTCDLNYKTY